MGADDAGTTRPADETEVDTVFVGAESVADADAEGVASLAFAYCSMALCSSAVARVYLLLLPTPSPLVRREAAGDACADLMPAAAALTGEEASEVGAFLVEDSLLKLA